MFSAPFIESSHQSEEINDSVVPFGMWLGFLALGMCVRRDCLINFRVLLVDKMLAAQECLKFIDVLDREIVQFDFVSLIAVGADVKLISHKRTLEYTEMFDAPFRYILLCDVILKDVEEIRFFRLLRLFNHRRIEIQLQLCHDKILVKFFLRGSFSAAYEELLHVNEFFLNFSDTEFLFRVARYDKFAVNESLSFDVETALDSDNHSAAD